MSGLPDAAGGARSDRGFNLEIRNDGRGGLELECPSEELGGPSEPFLPPVAAEEMNALLAGLEHQFLESVLRSSASASSRWRHVRTGEPGGLEAVDIEELSGKLYESLFRPRIASGYSFRLGEVHQSPGSSLRLRLVMDPADPEVAPFCALPWELLIPPGQVTPLALNPLRTVVRALKPARPLPPPPLWPEAESVRVLLAGASPPGEPELDLEAEHQAILAAGRGYSLPSFEILLPATVVSLRERLMSLKPHVVHLMAHGDFDSVTGEGYLLLAGEPGGEDRVSGSDLMRLLAGLPQLQLVVLNACRGTQFSRRSGLDPWSGVAQTLIREGVPAVVAHQFPISDRAAIAFSGGLYGRLMVGESLEAAVAEGRQAISTACRGALEWATPVLYTRFSPSAHPEPGIPPRPGSVRSKVRDQTSLVASKTEGFVGRDWFFEALVRFRERCHGKSQGGYFVVYGDPGIGKTSLLAETVRRFGCTHHFNVRRQKEAETGTFLENLCAQMILRFGLPYSSLPPETTRDGGTLTEILQEVSARLDPKGPPELFAVDALDEAQAIGLPATNPLFLPSYLPPRLVFLLTSQRLPREPEFRCELDVLNIDRNSPENQADVLKHLRQRFPHPQIQAYLAARKKPEERLLAELFEKSEGNFMYLHYVLAELEQKGPDFLDIKELPVGLKGYYESHWDRMRVHDDDAMQRLKVQVLLALAIATEPISLETIVGHSSVADRQTVLSVLRQWRPFLERTLSEDEDGKFYLYNVYHDSFRGFLRQQETLLPELVDFQRAHLRAMEHLAQGRREGGV